MRWSASLVAALVAAALSAGACSGGGGAPAPPETPHGLVPLPAEVVYRGAGFTIGGDTVITAPPEAEGAAGHLAAAVREVTGRAPRIGEGGAVRLELTGGRDSGTEADPGRSPGAGQDAGPDALLRGPGAEAYELTVDAAGIRVRASRPVGLFRGVQTLGQLLPATGRAGAAEVTLPGVRITDRPRFAWRGAMLDVARHFFTVDEVKRYVDLVAAYKINVLHLHLSDDQGWRLAVAGRPELTRIGGATEVGGGPGGFYTEEDYREIVAHARERFVEVVPEIDMPGHVNAALAADPALSCDGRRREPYTGTDIGFSALCVGRPAVDRFLADVIGELARLTPGPYLHIGGDEVSRLTREQFDGFVERAQELVVAQGKRAAGWQEIGGARLAPGTVTQYWRTRGTPEDALNAVRQGGKLVMSPASRTYLDMKYDEGTRLGLRWAGFVEVEDAYDWDPAEMLPGVGDGQVLGVEAPLWTETAETVDDLEYLAFPRLPAVAEVAWTPRSARDFDGFAARLARHGPRWTALGVDFHRSAAVAWPG
ncbi:beta-N-acetylhexosaminidase [Planomonospora sp. ID67723]|uniref:beta-N-acetylhexosaminidase n=1 Tax=Planomonospora sp. ID67723 TaxID=2738134 RepID=UPI0018C3C55D|nr:family 20 glycosylhydrolase [Planomonospora sp. ID67723]MBG0833403.1 beta-N-acetylhexosaminidase [Planomonospora sp. ID67723]